MARAPIFEIVETTVGMFSLTSSDFQPFMESFESHELAGGGYDWEQVAMYLLENCESSLLSEITFDSEASMFCACANSRVPLTRLMALLQNTLRSKKRLAIAISESRAVDDASPHTHDLPCVVVVYFEGYVPEVETVFEAISRLNSPHQQTEDACCSGRESVVFVRTQNVDATVECCVAALSDAKLLSFALIGSKAAHDKTYEVLWPKGDSRILKPTFDTW